MAMPKVEFPEWNPTEAQRATFNEWKGFTIGHLVSCKMGVQPYKLPAILQEQVGDRIPLAKMGLSVPNINHFLFQMSEDLLLRTVDGSLFVFIKENAVPDEMENIRKMVLGQRKDRNDYPLRYHGEYARFTELLKLGVCRPPQQFQATSGPGSSGTGYSGWGNPANNARRHPNLDGGNWGSNASRQPRRGGGGGGGSRNYSGRMFNFPGLDDDDDSDYDDLGGFDMCSGVAAPRPLEKSREECGPPTTVVAPPPAPKVEAEPKDEQVQVEPTPSSGIKNEVGVGATAEAVKADVVDKVEPEPPVMIPTRPRIGRGRGRARAIPWVTNADNIENFPPKVAGYSMADMEQIKGPKSAAGATNTLEQPQSSPLTELKVETETDTEPQAILDGGAEKKDILPGQGRRFKSILERAGQSNN